VRLATIDLGSNTVRLLVVEVQAAGDWRPVDQDQRVTRLGEGLAATGRLGAAPTARTAAVVEAFVARARAAGAGAVRIVATSAVREAANGAEFARVLAARTGHAVVVVTGEEEARLTVGGVLRGLGDLSGAVVVVDIGGGSTEYTLARAGRIAASVSLGLGVVPLAERYPFPDGADPARSEAMRAAIRDRLRHELPAPMRAAPPDHLVGTAGTVTTLAALDLGLATYDAARVQGHRLTRAAVERLAARLGALPVAVRAALPCLEPGRADLIVPGVAIVLATLDVLGVDRLLVSDWGLREGLVADLVDGRRP
jgi:exopolyphosphatase / guanosine-5'-triphosphate,3'-diphosphate pyrophosphatase